LTKPASVVIDRKVHVAVPTGKQSRFRVFRWLLARDVRAFNRHRIDFQAYGKERVFAFEFILSRH